ncbi:acetyl-CoA synthetase [Ancylomarina euxinus]|uniref:Tricorn protease homolog n=1 Tax=Ancylomarina euxinus TaxID=2283627 RepID=A0A425XZ54_9BACT|nr:S41 family peptidase [Ancylomarina euxinus]MCZ4695549.1 PDZ domain-containing protein [Ancylomarina euxinus]MUP15930.1 acetyl-CoA synthetase [Ancylomarina euxinus]RRG20371.1 acetyl-CoA synthetase [Ancylomarina euxinus]
MQKKNLKIAALFLIIMGMIGSVSAQKDARLMRYPDVNKNLIAFVYAGDIWSVDAKGGDATRLTSHKGMELFPKISPDGQWIAFSGEYSGSRQVYVMPAAGGTPRQLTYYNSVGLMPPRGGFDNVVLDWTPDSQSILVRMNRTPFGERIGTYYKVSLNGGLEQPLQIPEGGMGVFSPDAKKMCFAPIGREFRTWKRYKGGRAADLWIYNLENDQSERITKFVGSDQIPSWYKDAIYFASDRDLKLNIYKYDIPTRKITQMTYHKTFDVMWPSGENGQLVYENGGQLFKLNLETGKEERVIVNIHFDNPNILPYYKNVKDFVQGSAVSPSGKRALLDARGDIFSVPAKNGPSINLTQTQGVRETAPTWSPDGKYISYYSDATGEYEIYLLENKKGAKAKQITSGSSAWMYDAKWSDNSKYLLFFDRSLKLKYLDIESGKVKVVDTANRNEITEYNFSPDSEWITYSKESQNSQSAIWVYNLKNGKNFQLTNDTFSDSEPVFSKDGNFIFFLSNRNFNLNFSSFEFNYLYNKATRIYAISLKDNGPKLFALKNDIEEVKVEDKKKDKKGESKSDFKIEIDLDGISDRISVFPMSSGDYGNLTAVDGGILYASNRELHLYTIEKEKDEIILDRVSDYSLSGNGKKIMYRYDSAYGIIDINAGQKVGDGQLNLDDLEMKIDPKKEWNQIYTDGWRIFRDYYYVANMQGIDWAQIKAKYNQLIPYVSHRADLDYIIGEIISETNTGHAYVNYGDFEKVKPLETGLLGAKIEADTKTGKYIISKIYQGENWTPNRRSPLTEQGVNVKEGDYLLSIDGHDLSLEVNPYLYLENTVDKMIEITVNSRPSLEGAKTYTITPIASELELMYLNWVNERREMVNQLSDGKIGYIHVPNTAVEGNRELHRGMYAYHDKQALIIDDRYNGGGFIPDHMADLLDRNVLSYWHRRGLEPTQTPGIAHDGPKAMLINHYSSSGGDAFPYYFRKKGLGKLIGTRTWGGLVGMSGNAGLVDGGYIAVPRFGIFDENQKWIIEGIGVYPDVEVYDEPHKVAKGIDPSIQKAVEMLLKELKEKPSKKVSAPKDPNRSKWIEEDVK